MKGFTVFVSEMVPERVREVIEEGPFPQSEYNGNGSKITHKDKQMGIMRFKGGTGDPELSTKKYGKGVVYYDPSFASPEYQYDDVPDEIIQQHSQEQVEEVFKEL